MLTNKKIQKHLNYSQQSQQKKRLWGKPPDSGSLGSEVDDDVSEGKYKLDSDAEEDEKTKEMK